MTTRADFVIRPKLYVRGEPKRGIRSASDGTPPPITVIIVMTNCAKSTDIGLRAKTCIKHQKLAIIATDQLLCIVDECFCSQKS
jgi:hypothetical protein